MASLNLLKLSSRLLKYHNNTKRYPYHFNYFPDRNSELTLLLLSTTCLNIRSITLKSRSNSTTIPTPSSTPSCATAILNSLKTPYNAVSNRTSYSTSKDNKSNSNKKQKQEDGKIQQHNSSSSIKKRKLWTPEEDQLLLNMIQKYGLWWTYIGSMIPGRTPAQVSSKDLYLFIWVFFLFFFTFNSI